MAGAEKNVPILKSPDAPICTLFKEQHSRQRTPVFPSSPSAEISAFLSPAIIGKDYVKHRVLSDYHCLRALKKLQVPRTMRTELGHCRESLNAKLLGKILPVLRSCSVYTGAWTLLLSFPKRALKTVIIYSAARQFS